MSLQSDTVQESYPGIIMSKITLYHYTTKEGKDGIESSRVIHQSVSGGAKDDARFGDGVYLTSLPPNSTKTKLLINNWDGLARQVQKRINWVKVRCYIALDLNTSNVGEVGDGDRDIYLHPGDLHITSSMNMRSGFVPKK